MRDNRRAKIAVPEQINGFFFINRIQPAVGDCSSEFGRYVAFPTVRVRITDIREAVGASALDEIAQPEAIVRVSEIFVKDIIGLTIADAGKFVGQHDA